VQGAVELSTDTERADHEAVLRAALGRTWTQGRFGRSWSPMLEVLASRGLEDGASGVEWDVVPQVQVTLNTRQHVMANAGVRLPVGERNGRRSQFVLYVLWDWFDGGFFDGW